MYLIKMIVRAYIKYVDIDSTSMVTMCLKDIIKHSNFVEANKHECEEYVEVTYTINIKEWLYNFTPALYEILWLDVKEYLQVFNNGEEEITYSTIYKCTFI